MNRILIDANLMCLVVAGLFAPALVGQHKRLRAFTPADFDAVYAIISNYQEVATCPHVLTETSNLLAYTDESKAHTLLSGLRTLLDRMTEISIAATQAMERAEYIRLGLTDAVLLSLRDQPADLLTVDLGLTLAAQRAGINVRNYNWLRDARQ